MMKKVLKSGMLRWCMMIVTVLSCGFVQADMAAAITLSPAQLEQLKQLSPAQRAALAKQAGVALPVRKQAKVPTTSPVVVKPRTPGNGALEKSMAGGHVPGQGEASAVAALTSTPPTRKGSSPKTAEKATLQRAFADFTSKSRPMAVDTHIKQFGYNLFAGVPTTFAPATDVPVPPEYVLGPGDEIKVQLFGKENSEFSMTVDRDGTIAFPNIGPLTVARMRFSQAKAFIAEQIKQKMIGVSASITMGNLRSIRVFSLGEVARPGSYVVSGLSTLSNALFVSGGVKKAGSLRNIQLKRAGKVVAHLDLYDFLLHGDTSHDVRLLPQDVVYVPPIGKTVGVAGQVLRPAIFELKHERTLADVLHLAGGLRPTAYRKKVQIERIANGVARKVLDVPLTRAGLKTRLHNGDLVKVYSVLNFEENPVFLLGNVKRPGRYAWHKGMHLRDLIPNDNALLPETYFKYALIERESVRERAPEILHVPLSEVLAGKKRIRLAPHDKVYVFNLTHFRQQPRVTIVGSVQSPGGYALKKNMHLVDLIMGAGGLLRDAYLDKAELYRTNAKNKDVTVTPYSLRRALAGKGEDNPLLRDMDRLVVHSIYEKHYRELVTIQGDVKKPGRFVRAVNMRASDLIFAAGGVTRDALIGKAQIYRTNSKTKEVSLITFNVGKALKGNAKDNPLLRDLDRVMIHSIWEVKRRYNVSASGEVKHPGKYTLAAGMRLTDLLFAAGNVTERAYMQQAEITRYSVKNNERRVARHIQVDLAAALRGDTAANIPLKPYDVLMVRKLSNWRKIKHATVTGQVRFPGVYPVEEGERLSSLLARVGGFTSRAYLPAAVFTRTSIRKEQQKNLAKLSKQMEADINRQAASISNIKDPIIMKRQQQDMEQARALLKQMREAKATGRLVIRLADMKHFKNSDFDLRLRNGDTLSIPQRPDQVLVLGQVYNQAALLYRHGFSPNDYVSLAGGAGQFADTDRIYIIRADGEVDAHHSAWRRKRVYPGDTIVVPEELAQFHLVDSLLDWSRVGANIGLTIASFRAVGVL